MDFLLTILLGILSPFYYLYKFINKVRLSGLSATILAIKIKLKLIEPEPDVPEVKAWHDVDFTQDNFSQTVLIIVQDALRTGAPLVGLNIAKKLKEEQGKDVIFLMFADGEMHEAFESLGSVFCIGQTQKFTIDQPEEVMGFLSKLRAAGCRLSICNGVVSGAFTEYLEKLGFVNINLIHELPNTLSFFSESMKSIVNNSADIVLPVGFVANEFLKRYHPVKARIHIKHQGVNIKQMDLSYQEVCQKFYELYHVPVDAKVIVGSGFGFYRKGGDFFMEVANYVLNHKVADQNLYFIWVGTETFQLEFIQIFIDAARTFVPDPSKILMMELTSTPELLFARANAYLLTSRTDPFPTVALDMIAHEVPVIFFENTGGIQDLIKDERCRVRRYDIEEMGDKLIDVLENKPACIVDLKQYLNLNGYSQYVDYLMRILIENRKAKFELFKVTVVVPNYNYAEFIEKRLNSIIQQTVQPTEILFLDDCSTDDSVQKAEALLVSAGIPFKIIKNDVNKGVYEQWLRGVSEASGDYVWIAEADDYCDNVMMEMLLEKFLDDPEVVLSYCQSRITNELEEVVFHDFLHHTNVIDEQRWKQDFINDGKDEIERYLSKANTIPNASAVIFKRSAFDGIADLLKEHKSCGDWLVYCYILMQGKVGYSHLSLNSFRRHSKTVTHNNAGSEAYLAEMHRVLQYIATIRSDQ